MALQIANDLSNYTFVRGKLSKEARALMPSKRDVQKVNRKTGEVTDVISKRTQTQLTDAVNKYLQLGNARHKIQKWPYVETRSEQLLRKAFEEPGLTAEQRAKISAALFTMKTLPDAARGEADLQVDTIAKRLHDQEWYAVQNYVSGDLVSAFDINEMNAGDIELAVSAILSGEMDPPEEIRKAIFDRYKEMHPEAVKRDETGEEYIDIEAPGRISKAVDVAETITNMYADWEVTYADPKKSAVLDKYRRNQKR